MTTTPTHHIKLAASWSTQMRLMQAIGKGLSELTRLTAAVVVGERGDAQLAAGEVDLAVTKSVNNQHQYTGKGLYAGKQPAEWLRTIAWLPQDDRFLFAVAPHTGITSFEDLAERKPALQMVGGPAGQVLREYGFSYDDLRAWGGSVGRMEQTARAAAVRAAAGRLDACFGDGSAFDGSCWRWMAAHGYRFLDIREDVMARLVEVHSLRRHVTPAGFLPGIERNLTALDDSHIVLSVRAELDDELAYLLAKVVHERREEIVCESVQVVYGDHPMLPLTQPTLWTSLTGRIERQWDEAITGAPLHEGARRYYREIGVL